MKRGGRGGNRGVLSAVCSAWVRSLGQHRSCCQTQEKKQEEQRGEDDGKQGRRAEQKVGKVEENEEKKKWRSVFKIKAR